MPVAGGPFIQKTGILLNADAANAASYTPGSTVINNVFNPSIYNGTLNGTIAFNALDSKGALVFPASNSYVDFGNIGNLATSWSFQIAVKPVASASYNHTILSYASGSVNNAITFKLDYSSSNQSAVLSAYSSTWSTAIVHTVTGSVPSGSWSIINASYGNQVLGMYVNGRPTDYTVTTGSTVAYSTNNRLYLGGTFLVTSSYYTGSIGSLFVYNSDVPNTQLIQNYNAFATRFGLQTSLFFPTSFDPDAFRFIEVAQITDQTQITAVNNLVVGLKGYNLWTKMVAIYPFVGGTAYSHKFNLKNPTTNQLIFVGGVTHDVNGFQPNGTNGYATTNLTDSTYASGDFHLAFYTNQSTTGSRAFSGDLSTNNISITAHRNNDNIKFFFGSLILQSLKIPPFSGFYVGSRSSTTSTKFYKDGINLISNNTLDTAIPTTTVYLGSINTDVSNHASPRAQQFASFGLGLTDTDVSNIYTLVQAYQTTLGRQI